ncbi:hypothetical protein CEXT_786911 [Caerostris extrusa]|uniref:Uncharacterized protein n=1 Tax=Caerostris extrusa TaxID=172846 RepID=A0AAV4Y8W1_CAEEX|nr:hypothetical protein CEXT_786911 [Caerostris extrusa]
MCGGAEAKSADSGNVSALLSHVFRAGIMVCGARPLYLPRDTSARERIRASTLRFTRRIFGYFKFLFFFFLLFNLSPSFPTML